MKLISSHILENGKWIENIQSYSTSEGLIFTYIKDDIFHVEYGYHDEKGRFQTSWQYLIKAKPIQ